MKLFRTDIFSFVSIFIISLVFVLELFMFPGRPAAFDTIFHTSIIAQFSEIIKAGEFPVVWMNSFANYGLPFGLYAHQTTNYLGGVIMLVAHDPVLTYNLLAFIAIAFSGAFLYLFLRLYFSPLAALLGTIIFNFAPYRILNIYIRGAMPEVFSAIFPPLILVALYLAIAKRKTYAFFLLTLFVAGLTLTHPMMLVVYSVLYIPYLIFLLLTSNQSGLLRIRMLTAVAVFMLIGVLIGSYFIVPLILEVKYFYYGLEKGHLTPNNYLSLSNYFNPQWYYFTATEIFPRGHVILFGLLESMILIFGLAYAVYKKVLQKSKDNLNILYFVLSAALLIIFFTTKYSDIFYQRIFFFNSIQFPWRFISALIFLPAIVAAFLYDRFPKKIIFIGLILTVAYFSFPQLYGKNYNVYPTSSYFFSKDNHHSVAMNTIWTGLTEDYPDKDKQGEIIDGQGKIVAQTLKNSSRIYKIEAATPVRMVDRTFYFPGWNVYVDNVKTNIEFQDPQYRGVITYSVAAGQHDIRVVFESTKIRTMGNVLSLAFISLTAILFLGRKYIKKYIFGADR